ncbi:MAG: RNA polymerase sigma factor RpoD/SigA [Bacteroidota bacterium]
MRQLKITHLITNRDSSTLEKYFNEISKIDLLTPEEEVILAQRIKQGDEQALERLVKANLRFVVSVSKQYHHGSMPLNDLINEGNVGLIKAARLFDETKGFKFISYAVWWIRQSIMDALNNHSRIVRIPANKIGDLSKINQSLAVIEQKFEREPTIEELADYMGLKVEDINSANTASISQSSLNAPIGEDEDSTLLDVIGDTESVDAVLANINSLKVEIERVLGVLVDRERDVIKQSFGIGYDYTHSLEDIAANMGLTRERVRQIRENALHKLRTTASLQLLYSYL